MASRWCGLLTLVSKSEADAMLLPAPVAPIAPVVTIQSLKGFCAVEAVEEEVAVSEGALLRRGRQQVLVLEDGGSDGDEEDLSRRLRAAPMR